MDQIQKLLNDMRQGAEEVEEFGVWFKELEPMARTNLTTLCKLPDAEALIARMPDDNKNKRMLKLLYKVVNRDP